MQWVRNHKPNPEQESNYRTALFITMGGNLALAVAKGVVAFISGSAALYADAANSASDVVYSVFMVLGLWAALRPPDLSHPQGHSRYEPLVGLAVTASMALAGFEAARNAISRYTSGSLEAITLDLPVIILLASALVKVGMYYSIHRISRRILSPTLATTARDNLSDVLTSLAAFVGILGSNLIHPLADPVAGLLVALWIFRNAFIAGRENLGFLTGRGAGREEVEAFIAAAESVPGVIRVHHIMTDYVGPRLMVDLHINVDGSKTLNESHNIS
ncbi:MAG TPA: cation diffusion facilitator family transporter, partial [Anaerolineaceae bacterium]|nr:cation diffusion facilitator family transporter [Anaerolineaceae bacterium]